MITADTFAATCGDFAALKMTMSPTTPARAVERAALTHALWCPTCRPVADRMRRAQAERTEQLATDDRPP